MSILNDTEREQLRQLVKACLLEISKLKIEIKKCQKESLNSKSLDDSKIQELKEEQLKEIQAKEDEIKDLMKQLNDKDAQIHELENFKGYFRVLTSKPKRDLTSFQSQIYMLLPSRKDTKENLFKYLRDLGFQELTAQNFEHALRNLERKEYFKSINENGQIFWKKLEKTD